MKKLHEFCMKFGYDMEVLSELHVVLRRNPNELLYVYFDANQNIKAIRSEVVIKGMVSSNNIFIDEMKFLVNEYS